MPRYKQDEMEFSLSVFWDGVAFRATIPKVLVDRLTKNKQTAYGTFVFNGKRLKMVVGKEV